MKRNGKNANANAAKNNKSVNDNVVFICVYGSLMLRSCQVWCLQNLFCFFFHLESLNCFATQDCDGCENEEDVECKSCFVGCYHLGVVGYMIIKKRSQQNLNL
jgi:hypothetical protein